MTCIIIYKNGDTAGHTDIKRYFYDDKVNTLRLETSDAVIRTNHTITTYALITPEGIELFRHTIGEKT